MSNEINNTEMSTLGDPDPSPTSTDRQMTLQELILGLIDRKVTRSYAKEIGRIYQLSAQSNLLAATN